MALRRDELSEIILRGEAVLHKGRVITRVEDLPSDIELAGDDIVHKQAAVGDIQSQIAKLQKELEAANKAAEKPAEDEAKTKAK